MTTSGSSQAASSPSEEERKSFRHSLEKLSSEEIRDKVLDGVYGQYDPVDPRRSDWRAREGNRLITERHRKRELRPQWIGIVVSTLIGLAGLIVAILAYIKQR
jgi:hypothetical protein